MKRYCLYHGYYDASDNSPDYKITCPKCLSNIEFNESLNNPKGQV